MDKTEKFLRKLQPKRRRQIKEVIEKILDREWKHLDMKKLKGCDKKVYRVRKGDMRIIFIDQGDDISVLSVGRRDEDTYKNL